MLLKEIMKKELVTAVPGTSVREAARKMKENDVGCLMITENGKLKGMLTDRDITCSAIAEGKDPGSTAVSEIMRIDLVFSSPEMDIFEAARLMADKGVRRLPIQGNGKLQGIVTVSDLAPLLKEEMDNFFRLEGLYRH